MKMARPSARDIDAAGTLMQILNDLQSGYYPFYDKDDPTYFDPEDREHLTRLYEGLDQLLENAPGFPGRVIGGMCFVICSDRNAILDPADDCLSLHPDLVAGLELLRKHRADFLPRLEREARAAVAAQVEHSAATHLTAMRAAWTNSGALP
ncbi:hypothetical protein [Paracidovorax oryzae]|uniref:hypothetical protein n=1 Tax=Paracidovorax oryzae TaxID=862720 RepID=UPI0002DD03D7|nr:hypothetical protein [Paracidovorax oryzae]